MCSKRQKVSGRRKNERRKEGGEGRGGRRKGGGECNILYPHIKSSTIKWCRNCNLQIRLFNS